LWSTHPFSDSMPYNTSRILPLRPEPIPGESLYSWLVRVARRNTISVYSILKTNRRKNNFPRALGNSWNDYWMKVIMEKTKIEEVKLKQLHTIKWKSLFQENYLRSNKIFTSKVKFCPQCLSTDQVPHFRLELKLNVLNTCPLHDCIVLNRCPYCNSEFVPHRVTYDESIYYCYNCQADLREIRPVTIISKTSTKNAESQIRTLLKIGTCSLLEQLNMSPPNFFVIFFQLASFLIHAYEITDPLFENKLSVNLKLKEEEWKKLKSKLNFLKNPLITYLLIEGVFDLLRNETKLVKYIQARQSMFNRVTGHLVKCSKYLQKYRKTRKKTSLTEKEIMVIIDRLKKAGKPINNRTVAKEGGFDHCSFNYGPNRSLRKLIDEANRDKFLQYERQIKAIIKEKKAKGERVSVPKVVREMGISHTVIYYAPQLARHFDIDRKIIPNYFKRIKTAINEIKREKKRITINEVARRANISRNVIHNHFEYKEIIVSAIRNSKHPKLPEIKEKIDALIDSGEVITREIIERETGINISVYYDYPELRELLQEAIGNNLQNHKKRLNKACTFLENQKMKINNRTVIQQAGMDEKTVYQNKQLHAFIKELVFESMKRRLINAKISLENNGKEISIKSLLKEANIGNSWKKNSNLKLFLRRNKELDDFMKSLIKSDQ